MPRGDHVRGKNESARINSIRGREHCPTCGQKLAKGPQLFVLDWVKKHNNASYIIGCRCPVCNEAHREYCKNNSRNRLRKKSKSGLYDDDGNPTGLERSRDAQTGRLIKMGG